MTRLRVAITSIVILAASLGVVVGSLAAAPTVDPVPWPRCHEDAAVVIRVSAWENGKQVPHQGGYWCAPLDDLYKP